MSEQHAAPTTADHLSSTCKNLIPQYPIALAIEYRNLDFEGNVTELHGILYYSDRVSPYLFSIMLTLFTISPSMTGQHRRTFSRQKKYIPTYSL